MGPTPTSMLVKDGMMYPVVGKSAAKCGNGSVAVAADLSTCTVAAHKLIYEEFVLGGPCGADGAI